MRRMLSMTTVLAVLLPFSVDAGEIFGSITQGNKPIGEKVKVEIVAANKATYATETDKNGSYRLFVKEKGKCRLTVRFNEQAPSAELFSYDKSLRYDWILEEQEGKYSVRRK
jgi:hypothetical protein